LDQAFNRLSFMAATTYYFKAIKERGIAPDLSPMPIGEPIQTPKALPALKLRNSKVKAMKLNTNALISSFSESVKNQLGTWFLGRLKSDSNSPIPEELKSAIKRESKKYFKETLKSLNHPTAGESRRLAQWFVDEHLTDLIDQIANQIKRIPEFAMMASNEDPIAQQTMQYDEFVRVV
jgi:hypothetical protein